MALEGGSNDAWRGGDDDIWCSAAQQAPEGEMGKAARERSSAAKMEVAFAWMLHRG
jgi:hypothetical protein